jgi:chromosomal replication initiator protein
VMINSPQTRVAYLTAEDFTNQMIAALKRNRIETFKERFRRECDILLLEEVQFLGGKEKIQDELVYTIDALLDAGKRVVFTSSEPPCKINKIKSNLESRLASGVTVAIDPPDHVTRVRILECMAHEEGINVDREVLEYLAQEVFGDVRRLQSALVGVMAKGSLTNRNIDISLAQEVLGTISQRRRRVSIEDIRDTVAKVYKLDMSLFVGKCRRKNVTRPRNMAMYLCRQHTDASYKSIGKVFNRDHATVIYGVEKVERGLKSDIKMGQEVAYLEERLGVEG